MSWLKQVQELRTLVISTTTNNPFTRTPEPIVLDGWQISFSRWRGSNDVCHCHLSVMLWPKGREHGPRDWEHLGEMVRAFGAPPEPTAQLNKPHAPVHWNWFERADGSPLVNQHAN